MVHLEKRARNWTWKCRVEILKNHLKCFFHTLENIHCCSCNSLFIVNQLAYRVSLISNNYSKNLREKEKKSHGIVFQGRILNEALTLNFAFANIKVQFSSALGNFCFIGRRQRKWLYVYWRKRGSNSFVSWFEILNFSFVIWSGVFNMNCLESHSLSSFIHSHKPCFER